MATSRFEPLKTAKVDKAVLPPYSITVFELSLGPTELKGKGDK